MSQTPSSLLCPCGSGSALSSCCKPITSGKIPATTAESLMRARYTAFVIGDVDFILNSHHPKTRDEVNREGIEEWSRKSEWLGLTILGTEAGGEKDSQGIVDFSARYKAEGKEQDHRERSLFEREKGRWMFVDAAALPAEPLRRSEPKVGRNDPCPCGSGKKHKKCCG